MELDLIKLIPVELLIIAVCVYCIGMFLKSSGRVPNWLIPIVLLIISILITIAYLAISMEQGFTAKGIVDGVIYGVLIAALAVYCNQVLKQVTNRD